ncbi:hypothetical protein T4D_13124 [Trichinella pseudospiralis]|uniref:Uncharacterized protein n=1 Tax=Trichinella pseudospiralis TaxID=6337 RepID=A0A0V1E3J8_TRIPS|nr:hypothetical protein T4D_13124 [Trichinella pseudospiralis]
MSSAKWQTCPEWDLKYLKQVEIGETKKWAPTWSVKLPPLGQGRVQTLPLLFGQVERTLPDPGAGKAQTFRAEEVGETWLFHLPRMCRELMFFPCSQGKGDCAFCLPNRVERTLPDPGAGKA